MYKRISVSGLAIDFSLYQPFIISIVEMICSSPFSDAAASACVHDIVLAEEEKEEALSWRYKELIPTGPFDSQKESVAAVENYSVRQSFAVSIFSSNRVGTKRVSSLLYAGKALLAIPRWARSRY